MKNTSLIGLCVLAAGCMPTSHAEPSNSSATPAVSAQMQDAAVVAGRQLRPPQADAARLIGAGWLSGMRNDYNLSTDAAQRVMVFARSAANFKDSRIWFARRYGDGWGEVAEATFSDPRYRDSDPWLTPDGRTMYFVSNRPISGQAPNASLDVWRVALDDAGFGVPEHLDALASEAEELGPELHDGWLYFNSSRKGGPAKMAIYRARMNDRGFDAPQPLDAPFNDGAIQGDFTLSRDGRLAVFWSQRGESRDADLFAACRTAEGWSAAVRLPPPINAPGMDFTPSLTADGKALRFASMRASAHAGDEAQVLNGQANIYVVPAEMAVRATEAALAAVVADPAQDGCNSKVARTCSAMVQAAEACNNL
ncbi:PD40 domain-containing protein [Lysobacter capsici]|uniref:PD40 domain-containing protein n=1 Tax=Lysobacter capsici TaxID=435897 RepID=UPI0009E3C10E|nr:PD40 domain-containing protein [Lysobacter capsici]